MLGWGLKYWVRGDVVFHDDSETTLDQLRGVIGLPALPYLVDVPPELEI